MASDERIELKMDLSILAKRTVEYFKIHYKKVELNSFYDKAFLDRMKIIIKNSEKFDNYLQFVNMNISDFISIGVFLFPQCFSSSVVKLLKEKIKYYKNSEDVF